MITIHNTRSLYILIFALIANLGFAQNPIIQNKGANDPHIRIIDGKAYLSASHNRSINDNGIIEAEDFYKASVIKKVENKSTGFSVEDINEDDYLVFNNVHGLKEKKGIQLNFSEIEECFVEVRKNNPGGELISTIDCQQKKCLGAFNSPLSDTENLCFVFKGEKIKLAAFDSFLLK